MRHAARLCFLLVLGGCSEEALPRVPTVGMEAPEYASATLSGDSVSLEDLRGKVVLLNVWATWCDPCREEIPVLQALHEAHAGEGLVVVGVSVDAAGERETISRFARELGMTYPIWHDQAGIVERTFRMTGVPNTFVIDRHGVLRWKRIGPFQAGDSALALTLRQALAAR